MKRKTSHDFLLEKGGALNRVGALKRDYVVYENLIFPWIKIKP